MKNIFQKILLILTIILLPTTSFGFDLASQVNELTLKNGMRWLFVKRAGAPVFSGTVILRAGGTDEVEGKTGVAHLFEHMAFKGGSRIGTIDYKKEKPILDEIEQVGEKLTTAEKSAKPDKSLIKELTEKLFQLEHKADAFRIKNELWEIMYRNGASDTNAYTSKDATEYLASMPSNKLKLWAEVVADMVFDPAYREFYTERKVVAEERRSGTDNSPDGVMQEKIASASFENGPYHFTTIGLEKDIQGLTIADARKFHDKFYVPGNMVGVLVGNFNLNEAKKVVEKSFGKYPAGPVPENPSSSGKPRGGAIEKLFLDAEPSVVIAWHKPTMPDPVEYTFDVTLSLLCKGNTSRLQKTLVYEKKMAQSIYCSGGYPGSRLPNLFLIWIEPLKPYSPDQILKEVSKEIEKLMTQLVDEEELTKARKNVTANLIFALDKNMGLAKALADFEAIFGDWHLLVDYPQRIAEVDAKKIMETAQKYLNNNNRVVVERLRKHK